MHWYQRRAVAHLIFRSFWLRVQGIPLAPLQSRGCLYILSDLTVNSSPANLADTAANLTPLPAHPANFVAPTASQLDEWFQIENNASEGSSSSSSTASPLQSFLQHLLDLRRRHSSLLLLVDDLQWLFTHSTREMEVLDAVATLQMAFGQADRDAATAASTPAKATPSASTTAAAFTIDGNGSSTSSSTSNTPLPSGIVLVVHGDLPVSPVLSILRRHSSTFIKLNALQTGYTKEISGVITVQQHHLASDYWTPIQRSHYKLTEANVKISAPGHSSSTLQQ